MEHLKHLNEAQKQAVLTTDGPLLVLAGAGAGKTRVIAHRILEIVKKGINPEAILAITFTNKAASEMRGRVLSLLPPKHGVPFISTFHSLGLVIIKEHHALLGLRRAPVIYDRADSLRAMKEALKGVGAEGLEPRAALAFVSRKKGDGIDAKMFAESAENPRERMLVRAWLKYDQALNAEGALDFDDLLLRAVQLLRTNSDVRTKYKKRFSYIHIDEYQDTNRIQSELAGLLVGEERHICAVGDVDQTIYSWRGAQIENILAFEKKFPGARVVMLEENYRSTKTILAAANDIIVKNQYRPEKNLFTNKEDGARLSLYQAFDEIDEAHFVARKISERLLEGAAPRDFAVLYRANFQSRAVEEALLNSDVPYQVLGVRFFERKEVKDALSFIRAALYNTPADLARIANTPPRGIGKVTLLKMLAGKEVELTGKMREKVMDLRNLLASIQHSAERLQPAELITFVIQKSGMERMLREDKIEGQERLENLRELVSLGSRHKSVEEFLESVALQSEQDELKEEKNAVRLMTVHASKGLEFPVVFIVGLEEGLFPYEREDESAADKEEERRLMYVAITRAMRKVYLSWASYRTLFGSKNPTLPSQFLTDISDSLLENESPERLGRTIYLD